MKIFLTASFLLLFAGISASAQSPLSPPERPPIPLTVQQQEEGKAKKSPPQQSKSSTAVTVKIPAIMAPPRISSGNAAIDAIVYEASSQHGLDPSLILSVMRQESGFNRNAVSPKGASGLMQLMPATAERFGVKNIFDVRENIYAGARYLRWLLDRFNGDVRLALAGYNAGEGAVEFYGYRIPPFFETQNYVRAIYSRYISLRSVNLPQPVTDEPAKVAEAPKEKVPTYNQIIVFKSANGNASAKKTL